jgi:hypothetical protein
MSVARLRSVYIEIRRVPALARMRAETAQKCMLWSFLNQLDRQSGE